jgi:hypothetical protein
MAHRLLLDTGPEATQLQLLDAVHAGAVPPIDDTAAVLAAHSEAVGASYDMTGPASTTSTILAMLHTISERVRKLEGDLAPPP